MVAEPGGVRLRYRVSRRPYVESVDWTGDLGLDAPDLAATAALAIGGPAEPERLERARNEVLARLRREGYLGAEVRVEARENPATNGRAVTFDVDAGKEAYVGRVEITGLVAAEAKPLRKALDLEEGEEFRERPYREGIRAFEEALHAQGFFEARVTTPRARLGPRDRPCRPHRGGGRGAADPGGVPGRHALGEEALRERLTFAGDRIVDEVEVRASAEQIEEALSRGGLSLRKVTGKLGGDAGDTRRDASRSRRARASSSRASRSRGRDALRQAACRADANTAGGADPVRRLQGLFVEERLPGGPRLFASTTGHRDFRGGGRAAARDLQRRPDASPDRHPGRRGRAADGGGRRRHGQPASRRSRFSGRSGSVPAIPGTRCEPRMPAARWSSSISGAGTAARWSG